MSKLSEQEIQQLFDAVEAYRKAHPDFDEALRLYEQSQRELQKTRYAGTRFSISETTSLDAPAILTYPGQMYAHPLLSQATAWILPLYRYVKEQGWKWMTPDVPVTNDDKVLMAWQQEKRILNIIVEQEEVSFITISEEDTVLRGDAGDGRALYAWLMRLENVTNGTD